MTSFASSASHASAEPMSLRQRSELINKYALELGADFHSSSAGARPTFSIFARRFFRLSHAVLSYLVLAGTIAALHTYLFTKNMTMRTTTALSRVVSTAWNSKQVRRLQKKVEFEFFVLILGCGNSFCLVLFWPGWIPIGLIYLFFWVLKLCLAG